MASPPPAPAPAPPPPPPPALMDELVEECLLRLPPDDDPGNLFRAALVCKGWRRIVTNRGFRRRFRELHGKPLILGFLHVHTRYGSLFTPSASSRPRDDNAYLRLSRGGWHAIDLRHGRVLLSRKPSLYGTSCTHWRSRLAVWDPVSGDHIDLPELPLLPQYPGWFMFTSKAAVLCATGSACDHHDCHHGHFLVVWMDATRNHGVDVYVYSSQAGEWTHQTSAVQDPDPGEFVHRRPVTLAGNALYFVAHKSMPNGILKYDMGTDQVSCVEPPPDCSTRICRMLLTTTEHGGLGIVALKDSRVHLWSREAGPNGVLVWVPSGVIELETVLPVNFGSISTVFVVHGFAALFIMTENAGPLAVDLVSNRLRKMVCGNSGVTYFVPYTSLCTPALPLQATDQLHE